MWGSSFSERKHPSLLIWCSVGQPSFFRLPILVLLVTQLVLGPVAVGLAQQSQTASGAAGAPGPAGGAGPKAGSAGGSGGEGGKGGVSSMTPAEDMLPGGQALSRAVVPDQYVLGPGDGLTVSLWDELSNSYPVRVTPDGKINIPKVGDFTVKDLTLTQVHALVQSAVSRSFRNVRSTVSLTSLRVFQVLVLGEVEKPGPYTATPVKRVSDVVTKAGGVLSGGSQRYVQVQRDGKVAAIADLPAFLRKGDESANPFVLDGDVIFVPPMGDQRVFVYISEVQTTPATGAFSENSVPYTFELKKEERLSTVITQIGGISPWWDLEGVLVQRETKEPEGIMRIPVNLRRLFLQRDESQDLVLEIGDQIYIPAKVRRVFLAGSVRTPAAYPYFPGRTADAYIAQAGGASLVADFDRSFIKRADGTVEPYSGVTEIDNGDTIIVREKLFKTWEDYFAVVGAISGAILSLVGFYAVFTNFGR